MSNLVEMSERELGRWLSERGHEAYRARQIRQWIWGRNVLRVSEMSNLPQALRQELASRCDVVDTAPLEVRRSDDGTTKCLLGLFDGLQVESVLIPTGKRATACVSTQVGCAMGCVFCASGLDGLERNLTGSEILQQVLWLGHVSGRRVSHVVFMGMGEPLANVEATVEAIEAMADASRLGLSARRITVSTIGLIEGIERLGEMELPITLAISLHAADEDLRRRLVPASRQTSLSDLMEAARAFYRIRNREVTLEYVLLKGVNDGASCARDLSRLVSGLRCNVNLIRYNPVASLEYASPTQAETESFARRLEQEGVNVQVRRSRGLQADAACGQLRKRYHRHSGSCLGKASHRKET